MSHKFRVLSESSISYHKAIGEAFNAGLEQLAKCPQGVFEVQQYSSGFWTTFGVVADDARSKI